MMEARLEEQEITKLGEHEFTKLGEHEFTKLGERELSKLRWRCRRGLLENDLFIERFFRQYEETITTRQAAGITTLMDLADNDLLDLLLRRKEPQGEVDTAEVRDVLGQMRQPFPHPTELKKG